MKNFGFELDTYLYRNCLSDKALRTTQGYFRYKTKASLLLVPDGPFTIEYFSPLIQNLKDYFHIVNFDLPSFGFSAPKNGYDHSFKSTDNAILTVMEHLKIKLKELTK